MPNNEAAEDHDYAAAYDVECQMRAPGVDENETNTLHNAVGAVVAFKQIGLCIGIRNWQPARSARELPEDLASP